MESGRITYKFIYMSVEWMSFGSHDRSKNRREINRFKKNLLWWQAMASLFNWMECAENKTMGNRTKKKQIKFNIVVHFAYFTDFPCRNRRFGFAGVFIRILFSNLFIAPLQCNQKQSFFLHKTTLTGTKAMMKKEQEKG